MIILMPIITDIDVAPEFNHPLVQAYIDVDDVTGMHLECIKAAIEYANQLLYVGKW